VRCRATKARHDPQGDRGVPVQNPPPSPSPPLYAFFTFTPPLHPPTPSLRVAARDRAVTLTVPRSGCPRRPRTNSCGVGWDGSCAPKSSLEELRICRRVVTRTGEVESLAPPDVDGRFVPATGLLIVEQQLQCDDRDGPGRPCHRPSTGLEGQHVIQAFQKPRVDARVLASRRDSPCRR